MSSAAAPVTTSIDLHATLHEIFGFSEFRALQQEAVQSALAGRDVLVVMPTGAGKSLCFQLTAALSPGVTIVVSPLVALMRDQVEALKARTSFNQLGCAYINSLQSADEQRYLLEELREGRLKLVYIAPERFRSPAFMEVLKSITVARFVVDEAHCISEWGHDFRPDYLSLKSIVDALGGPPLMAVTATATRRVQESIVKNLGMREPEVFVGGFNRPNLHFAVHRCKNEQDRHERLARALPKLAAMGGSGLIYVATRKQCDEIAALASRALAASGKKAGAYHAGLDANLRNAVQSQWLDGEVQVLVATNAFGMGIDKPDVRFVVHYAYPESLESYYQEAGRAGRDGRKSRCVVLYHFSDRRTREWFIENEEMTTDAAQKAHSEICAHSPENTARIPKTWWSQSLGWNEVKTRLALAELERGGLIQRVTETGDEMILQIVRRDFPPEAARRITAYFERHREERYRRLDEMVAYCKTTACRRRTVLNYFGDIEEPDNAGFCCDNCDHPAPAPVVATSSYAGSRGHVPMPQRVDNNDIHEVLHALDALRPSVGKARLNKLLRGSNSKDVQRFKESNCPLYGIFRGSSEAQVHEFLEKLISEGLLHEGDEDAYFVCQITAAGREVWQGKTPLPLALPSVPRRLETIRDSGTDNADRQLFEALRNWRRKQASAENLPPYCILSDRALLEIASQKPQNTNDLRGITGIGETKLTRYGAKVLEIARGVAEADSSRTEVEDNSLQVVESTPAPPQAVRQQSPQHKSVTAQVAGADTTLPETVADTYVLLQEGYGIEEIAEQRALTTATIWSHLEKIINAGFLDEAALEALIPQSLRESIEVAFQELGLEAGFKPIWEKLGGEVDYGPIRCIAACQATV